MTNENMLSNIEREAYHASSRDGVIDLFAGVSLVWIGAAWIWLPGIAGLAGVFPAIFVASIWAGRKRLIEERAGYVRWSAPRRRWERRNSMLVLAAGVAMFLFGIGAFMAFDDGPTRLFDSIGPAILAWLLALMAIGLAFMLSAPRMLLYGAALAISGAIAAAIDANPGLPLLISGAVAAVAGGVLLRKFLADNPRVQDVG